MSRRTTGAIGLLAIAGLLAGCSGTPSEAARLPLDLGERLASRQRDD